MLNTHNVMFCANHLSVVNTERRDSMFGIMPFGRTYLKVLEDGFLINSHTFKLFMVKVDANDIFVFVTTLYFIH